MHKNNIYNDDGNNINTNKYKNKTNIMNIYKIKESKIKRIIN